MFGKQLQQLMATSAVKCNYTLPTPTSNFEFTGLMNDVRGKIFKQSGS